LYTWDAYPEEACSRLLVRGRLAGENKGAVDVAEREMASERPPQRGWDEGGWRAQNVESDVNKDYVITMISYSGQAII